MNESELMKRIEMLSMTRDDLFRLGAAVGCDPDEADELGAFPEDAISEEDALEGVPVW